MGNKTGQPAPVEKGLRPEPLLECKYASVLKNTKYFGNDPPPILNAVEHAKEKCGSKGFVRIWQPGCIFTGKRNIVCSDGVCPLRRTGNVVACTCDDGGIAVNTYQPAAFKRPVNAQGAGTAAAADFNTGRPAGKR